MNLDNANVLYLEDIQLYVYRPVLKNKTATLLFLKKLF